LASEATTDRPLPWYAIEPGWYTVRIGQKLKELVGKIYPVPGWDVTLVVLGGEYNTKRAFDTIWFPPPTMQDNSTFAYTARVRNRTFFRALGWELSKSEYLCKPPTKGSVLGRRVRVRLEHRWAYDKKRHVNKLRMRVGKWNAYQAVPKTVKELRDEYVAKEKPL